MIMSNFGYLKEKKEYAMFAPSAVEAERVYFTSPAMCAIGCRKAAELAVKWVYAADKTMSMPFKDNLMSLIHEESFRFSMDNRVWKKLLYIVKLGNQAVHTEKSVNAGEAAYSLKGLFEFVQWIDYCYGAEYEDRSFDEKLIPKERVVIDKKKVMEQEGLLNEKQAVIEELQWKIEELSGQLTERKSEDKEDRIFEPDDITEYETRKRYIDLDLKEMGWIFEGADADVIEEYHVEDMYGIPGKNGRADYVLLGRGGMPLAVIEAKRTGKDKETGRKEARAYAECIEKKTGRYPLIFLTNGFETSILEGRTEGYHERDIFQISTKDDLERLINRRDKRAAAHDSLLDIKIDEKITDRPYQMSAVRAACERFEKGFRTNLLVMATGTGKTRTAISLVDVLSRGGYVTNVLFLADRTALVRQAKAAFRKLLPEMSLCNLCENKDDRNARIIFSTYPTMLNAINTRDKEGRIQFTPGHFDLIITDESHRSIFKKYADIFAYFDSLKVGLTATPIDLIDRSSYSFFEMQSGMPTYAYDYETAVYEDYNLVPYYAYEVKTEFLSNGINYEDLSDEDKAKYDEDFAVEETSDDEEGRIPDKIPAEKLNKYIFNADTVDRVITDLMERGIKTDGGNKIGKTIIFAQSKKHAEYIRERFYTLYPMYSDDFMHRVICEDVGAQHIIDEFKQAEKEPQIVVSVDMMDTGVDVPECVNLVFFKKVYSKIKFWQMLGRGTRLCEGLICQDLIDGDYIGKRRFVVFDYCNNFEFFNEHPEGYEGREAKSRAETVFDKRVDILIGLQDGRYMEDEKYISWHDDLADKCRKQVVSLVENETLRVSVKRELRYIEKYKEIKAYEAMTDMQGEELKSHVGHLVISDEPDPAAEIFDNFMYGMILTIINEDKRHKGAEKRLKAMADGLISKGMIKEVQERMDVIKELKDERFYEASDIYALEEKRRELRGLMKFLSSGGSTPSIYTDLTDPVIFTAEGRMLDAAYDFEDYRQKVNEYIIRNGNVTSIYKLKYNLPLTAADYGELERILTVELGSHEDYEREFGDTPFGLLVRKIAKLDHEAVNKAFASFINDESLNSRQIAFVQKVISYIENNGYMEISDIQKPPFDRPVSFLKLFDPRQRESLIGTIKAIRDNAASTA